MGFFDGLKGGKTQEPKRGKWAFNPEKVEAERRKAERERKR